MNRPNNCRSSRVQGSWATSSVSRKKEISCKSKPPNDVSAHSWAGKQCKDLSTNAHTFQAVSPNLLKEAPKLRILRENGEYILGTTLNGESKIRLDPDFLDTENADWMFETLLNEVSWEQQINKKYGTNEGRLTKWFSNYPYSYSGVVQPANSHWHPLITALCDRLNETYHMNFNSVLANYYRDGHDSVDWHTDSEPALGRCPAIASLSFGDTRNFELRPIVPREEADIKKEVTGDPQIRTPLTHGCLLLMLGATQHDWQHRVPREYHDRGARINLTFRVMHPEQIPC